MVEGAGNVAVLAENSIEGLVQLESFSAGGLFWSSADANHSNISEFTPAGLSITNDSLVEIGADAVVTGRTARLEARTTQIKGTVNAGALAFIVMLIGVSKAYAEANIGIRSDTNVVIKPRAKVTGFQGVDIRARTDEITLLRRASRLGVGLFPPQAAVAGFCDGNNGSCWEAVPNASEGWNTGSMVVHTTIDADADAHVTAGVRAATGGPLDHPAQGGTNGNYPALALFVEAFTANPSDTTGEFKVWTSSIGGDGSFDHYRGSVQQGAEIKWDADVTVLGGSEGEPVLVVDDQGIVRRVNGVKLRCDAVQTTGPCTAGVSEYTPTVNASVDPDGNGSYTIADIVNGGFGNVLMSARSTSSDAIRNETSTDAAGWPVFDFKVTLPGVTIVDRSGLKVTINKIDVVKPFSATDLPIVWLISDDDETGPANNVYQLEFDVQQSAGDAFVDIQKFGAALLTLNGAINNPAGWTRIFSALGDIASSSATAWITTNTLDLVALAGSIGGTGAGQRINIQLVQSLDRGVLAIATDDKIRSTQLFVEANGNVALRIEGHDRVPGNTAPFVVYVDRISSTTGTVDVLLEESIRDTGPTEAGRVNVRVYDTATSAPANTPGTNTYNANHATHFLPDVGTAPAVDPAVYVSSSAVIDSTYRFEARRSPPTNLAAIVLGTTVAYQRYTAGRPSLQFLPSTPTGVAGLLAFGSIIVKDDGVNDTPGKLTVVAFTDLRDVDFSVLAAASITAVLDIDVDGAVTATEVGGDMRVGLVRSRTDDVVLTAARHILDGVPTEAALGPTTPPTSSGATSGSSRCWAASVPRPTSWRSTSTVVPCRLAPSSAYTSPRPTATSQ